MTTCLHCDAELTNGRALCERCKAGLLVWLDVVPVYFRNLARWKPGRAASRPVPGSREPAGLTPAPSDALGELLDVIHADIVGWARALHDDRGVPLCVTDTETDAVSATCAMLATHLESIATVGWLGDLVYSLSQAEPQLREYTERVVPGWYAGRCQALTIRDGELGRCEWPTYVVPGLTWVTCGLCGDTTHASTHLEVILDEARDWVARPKDIAAALVALLDTEPSVTRVYARIRQWAERGRITAILRTERGYAYDESTERFVPADLPAGQARYRFGDVLDLMPRKQCRAAS